MQLHERVRVQPVAARGMAAVDEDDLDIGVIDQRVGERHTHRARTHDEEIGRNGTHNRGFCPRRCDHDVRSFDSR